MFAAALADQEVSPGAPLRGRRGVQLQQLAPAGQLCPFRAGAEPGGLPVQGTDVLQVIC